MRNRSTNNPYLLLIPPWLGNKHTFTPLIQKLDSSVIKNVIELPGYGVRPEFVSKMHTIENYAEFLQEEIEKLPKQCKVFILGCSIGAAITVNWFKNNGRDKRIKGFIFLSPLLHQLKIGLKERLTIKFILTSPIAATLLKRISKTTKGRKFIYKHSDENIKSSGWTIMDKYVLKYIGDLSHRAMIESAKEATKYSWPDKFSINLPTKVIFGREDSIYKNFSIANYKSYFTGDLSIEAYKGGFHFILLQKPKEAAQDINTFIKKYS